MLWNLSAAYLCNQQLCDFRHSQNIIKIQADGFHENHEEITKLSWIVDQGSYNVFQSDHVRRITIVALAAAACLTWLFKSVNHREDNNLKALTSTVLLWEFLILRNLFWALGFALMCVCCSCNSTSSIGAWINLGTNSGASALKTDGAGTGCSTGAEAGSVTIFALAIVSGLGNLSWEFSTFFECSGSHRTCVFGSSIVGNLMHHQYNGFNGSVKRVIEQIEIILKRVQEWNEHNTRATKTNKKCASGGDLSLCCCQKCQIRMVRAKCQLTKVIRVNKNHVPEWC